MYELNNEKTPLFKSVCSYVLMKTKINRMNNKRLAPKKKKETLLTVLMRCVAEQNYRYIALDPMETSRGLNNQTF